MVLFPAFQAIDVFGPLDALNILSFTQQLNLTLISTTLDPVSTKPLSAAMNVVNSSFGESIVPTHTFDNAPELDVLIVPGGVGTRAPAAQLEPAIQFVKERFPTLKYFISVCTGAGIAARAGVLDGNMLPRIRSHGLALSFGDLRSDGSPKLAGYRMEIYVSIEKLPAHV